MNSNRALGKSLSFYLGIAVFVLLQSSCKTEDHQNSIDLTELNYRSKNVLRDSQQVQLSAQLDDATYDYTLFYKRDSISYRFSIESEDSNYIFDRMVFRLDQKDLELVRINNEKVAAVDGRAYYYFYPNGRLFAIKSNDWPNYSFYIANQNDRKLMNIMIDDSTCFFFCPKPAKRELEPIESQDSLLRLDPENPNLPDWIRALLIDTSSTDSTFSAPLLLAFQPLNDSIAFSVLQIQQDNCSVLALAITKYKKRFAQYPVARNCEAMDSIPIHIWTEYEVLKDGTIHTYTFTECFAQPDSMGNLPCNPGTDSSQRSFRIDPSGTFEALN